MAKRKTPEQEKPMAQERDNVCGVEVPTYPKDLVVPGPGQEAEMVPCDGTVRVDEQTGIARCDKRGHIHRG